MRWAALACALQGSLAALALTGCETTQEKSARLEKAALHRAGASLGAAGLKIARPSRSIKVLSATTVHTREGTAVAVTLRNGGAAQREVPILIDVAGTGSSAAYSNSAPGLARSLVSVPYVPAHGSAVWVDDQVPATGSPGAAGAIVGEGKAVAPRPSPPAIVIGSQRLEEEPGGIAVVHGTVSNRSSVAQHELVVYAVVRKGGRLLAAGRGVLSDLAGGASSPFQIFLVGTAPKGAQLQLSAPPSTLG